MPLDRKRDGIPMESSIIKRVILDGEVDVKKLLGMLQCVCVCVCVFVFFWLIF